MWEEGLVYETTDELERTYEPQESLWLVIELVCKLSLGGTNIVSMGELTKFCLSESTAARLGISG